MPTHKKHDDSGDVQIRTKILDEYGNPIPGAIEYDPATGYGKRLKPPYELGLTEPFYYKDGSIEIDGHNFDDSNHDENKVDAIRTLIDTKVARGTPEYENMLQHHINVNRDNEKQRQKDNATKLKVMSDTVEDLKPLPKFIATTQIARGEEIEIDFETGHISGTRSKNIHHPEREIGPDKESFA